MKEMVLERGVVVPYEAIRRWACKFGAAYAKQLRKRKPSRKDVRHLDGVMVPIGDRKH